MSTVLIAPRNAPPRLSSVVAGDEVLREELWAQFQSWLEAGGYPRTYVETTLHRLRQVLPEASSRLELKAQIQQARVALEPRLDLAPQAKKRYVACLEKLREFWLFQHGKTLTRAKSGVLPRRLTELPEWLREPVSVYLRLRQRNWPEHALRAQTQNLVCQLGQILSFFLTRHQWNDWRQLSVRWVDEYIDRGL